MHVPVRTPEEAKDPAAPFMKVASFGDLEYADCTLCGESRSELITRQYVFGENFHIVQCTGCGLMRTNPRPDSEWKEHFYDPAYNGYMAAQARDFLYAPEPSRARGYSRLLNLLESKAAHGASLLDVGCAAGLFVKEAKDRGFDAYGCDYSAAAIAYGKEHFGVHIIPSMAEDIDAPDDHYDVVTILHVIEHMPDPMRVMRELRRVLKPGGLLLMETVNYRAHHVIEKHLQFLIPIYGRLTNRGALPWVPFDHLYFWTPETLHKALETAGFKDVQSHHLMGYRSQMKPSPLFGFVYSACDIVGRTLLAASGGRWQFWPVLLATGMK